jgi:hypothetical protein
MSCFVSLASASRSAACSWVHRSLDWDLGSDCAATSFRGPTTISVLRREVRFGLYSSPFSDGSDPRPSQAVAVPATGAKQPFPDTQQPARPTATKSSGIHFDIITASVWAATQTYDIHRVPTQAQRFVMLLLNRARASSILEFWAGAARNITSVMSALDDVQNHTVRLNSRVVCGGDEGQVPQWIAQVRFWLHLAGMTGASDDVRFDANAEVAVLFLFGISKRFRHVVALMRAARCLC